MAPKARMGGQLLFEAEKKKQECNVIYVKRNVLPMLFILQVPVFFLEVIRKVIF